MEHRPGYQPKPRTAPFLAGGVALFVLGLPAALTMADGFVWAGWLLLAGAAALLGVGVFRLADRADSESSPGYRPN